MSVRDELKWRNSYYRRFRKSGMSASYAWRSAGIVDRFTDLESDELVRIQCEVDDWISIDDLIGIDESDHDYTKYKRQTERLIEANGIWVVSSQVKCPCCGQWQTIDSVGAYIPGFNENLTSPFDNWYVVDLMSAAIDDYESRLHDYENGHRPIANH